MLCCFSWVVHVGVSFFFVQSVTLSWGLKMNTGTDSVVVHSSAPSWESAGGVNGKNPRATVNAVLVLTWVEAGPCQVRFLSQGRSSSLVGFALNMLNIHPFSGLSRVFVFLVCRFALALPRTDRLTRNLQQGQHRRLAEVSAWRVAWLIGRLLCRCC